MLKKIIEKLRTPGVLIFTAALLLTAAGIVLALCLRPDEPGPSLNSDAPSQEQSQTDGTAGDEQGTTDIPDWIEGTEGTSPAEQPTETVGGGEKPTEPTAPSDPQKPEQSGDNTTPADPVIPQVTVPPTDPEDLEILQYSSFSGIYVEDGSDEPVEKVAALLVTNPTERYLDMGTVTVDIDGKEATFRVTGLPAGASAWVMEVSRMAVTADSKFTPLRCDTVYRDGAVSTTEDVTIQSAGTMLKAVNNTDKTLKNVTVYYKVLHTDGNFFGGITYMVAFGDLEPGASAEKLAGHFKEGWTNIVRIGYQSE